MKASVTEKYNERPGFSGFRLCLGILAALLLVWSATAIPFDNVKQNGMDVARNILAGILKPDTDLLFNLTKQGVPYLLFETVAIAFLGTLAGAVLALPFSFLCAVNLVSKPLAAAGRLVVMAVRTIPAFVYGLMFIRVTGPGPFAGLLTMSVCSIGMISKMYIEAIEDLDPGILESLDAAGLNGLQKIRYGILPQLIPHFLSTLIYRFDMNLRDAAVLGLVGAGGIGAPLIFAMSSYRWNEVGSILTGLILLVLFIEFFSTKVRTRLTRGIV